MEVIINRGFVQESFLIHCSLSEYKPYLHLTAKAFPPWFDKKQLVAPAAGYHSRRG
jgi:hypothetical protein